MGGPESTSSTEIYQLKIFLREISPMIYRRLLVSGDTNLLELHEIIQIAMGWEGYHLWTFSINGREYGHAYGMGLRSETYKATLSDLGLCVRERFLYEYDFGDYWRHEVRLEKILKPEPTRGYPICIGGKRSCPPKTAEDRGPTRNYCTWPALRSGITSVGKRGRFSAETSTQRPSTADKSTDF